MVHGPSCELLSRQRSPWRTSVHVCGESPVKPKKMYIHSYLLLLSIVTHLLHSQVLRSLHTRCYSVCQSSLCSLKAGGGGNEELGDELILINVGLKTQTNYPEKLNINYTSGDCHDVVCSNTGFKVNVSDKCSTTVTASHLPGTYKLAQFHAHWSKDGTCGSEHLLNGKAMSGEIRLLFLVFNCFNSTQVHFVFWNTKYETMAKAAEQDDGFAVIGVFIKEGAHSDNYDPLFKVIQKAIGSSSPVPMPSDFVLEQLFPPAGCKTKASRRMPSCEDLVRNLFRGEKNANL
ncbi:unnamed protein product [Strongylus vulgaris]|uniref:Alpha-carbonic anhydrase domain-containing protein n=1 Tax=Strongylus vulgaris TaxID=40348 RepID=A0A3P7KVX0_STRVU|nr:unnamed protein product [Strongylus vulgaris]